MASAKLGPRRTPDGPHRVVSEVAFDREHTDGFGEFYGTESWRQTEDVVY